MATTDPPATAADHSKRQPTKSSSTGGLFSILGFLAGVLGIASAGFYWTQAETAKSAAEDYKAAAAAAENARTSTAAMNDALLTSIVASARESDANAIEWEELLDQVETAASKVASPAGRAKLLHSLCKAHKARGRYRNATTLAKRALESAEDTASEEALLTLRSELAFCQLLAGDIPEGTALCDELLTKSKSLLEDDQSLRLALLNASANADFMRGELDKGLAKAREAMKGREDAIDKSPNPLFALNSMVMIHAADQNPKKAIPLAERLSRLWEQYNPEHIAALANRNTLATLYGQQSGKQQQSIEALAGVLEQMKLDNGAKDPRTLQVTSEYVRALIRAKKYEKAIEVAEPAVETARAALGDDHAATLKNLNGLALAYHFSGKHEDAVPLLEEVLVGVEKQDGEASDAYLQTIFDLSVIQFEAGQLADAMQTAEQARSLFSEHRGPKHERTQLMTFALADLCSKNQRYERAAELFAEHYAWRVEQRDTGQDTLSSGLNAGIQYRLAGQPAEAIKILTNVRQQLGEVEPNNAVAFVVDVALARAEKDTGSLDNAATLASRVLETTKSSLGPEHGLTCDARACMFEILMKQEKYAEAEDTARELFDVIKDSELANTLRMGLAANMIAEAQLRQDKYAGARQLMTAIVGGLKSKYPNHTLTASTNILLGEAAQLEGDLSQAEKHLMEGHEALQKVSDTLTADDKLRLARSRQLLAQLFKSKGDDGRASEFSSELN